jgi:hypothetical protein
MSMVEWRDVTMVLLLGYRTPRICTTMSTRMLPDCFFESNHTSCLLIHDTERKKRSMATKVGIRSK